MHYTLHQLNVYLKVAEKQSITKAAEELHLTQPAVSIQLKKFQDQFDIPLVEQVGRQLFITEFGREIAIAGAKILEEVESIRSKTLAFKGLLAGKLTISVVSTGKYVMPYFLSDFTRKHPAVELRMDVTNKANVIENLKNNEVDFALVSVLPEDMKIKRLEFMQNKLYFVRKPEPASRARIKIKDMNKNLLIYREKGSATRSAMERYITGNEIPSSKSIELTSNEAVKQAVMAGLGYSIMPLIGIRNELENNQLEIINIKGLPITTTWNLIWLAEKKLSPAASAYLEDVRLNKDSIISNHFQWYEKY